MNDSVTKLKEVARAEAHCPKSDNKDKSETANLYKNAKCSDTCKVKSTTKKQYDEIRCSFCMEWFHEACVGIKKDDPVGLWVCLICRNVPKDLKKDIDNLKREVDEIKKCTLSAVTAIEGLASKLENNIGSLKDQLTAVSRQINSKELCMSESIESLQTTTNNLKTSVDQKTCQILNKTTAVFDTVKTHSENFKTLISSSPKFQSVEQSRPIKQSNESHVKINNPKTDATTTRKIRKPNDKPRLSKGRVNTELPQKLIQSVDPTEFSNDKDDPIDLTGKKPIKQSTLLVGSSILKGVKTNELKQDTTVRSFSGATTVTLKDKLSSYNLEKCKIVILHVGGNDADDGKDLNTFCEDYISLLESLVENDRRIIVSGLLPRKGKDLEPYNEKLKSLCEENNIDFVNNYDSFLLASGELPATYYRYDKIHLNVNGTRRLLSNVDSSCKITRPASRKQTAPPSRMSQISGNRSGLLSGRGPRSFPKFCHICSKRGHSTQECWFNGRAAGIPDFFSH